MDTSVLLPVDEHPLIPSARFVRCKCWGCFKDGHIYGGYYCTECFEWYHKECAEAPLEINHPSHPQHPLKLESESSRKCGLCGISGWSRGYGCSLCNFDVDLACALKSPPLIAAELPKPHDHSQVVHRCDVCEDMSEIEPYLYHVGCANLSQEINHVSHPKHSLMLVTSESLSVDKTCLLCGEVYDEVLYHCSTCNFTLCPFCGRNPPPLTIEHSKTHAHKLTLWPRQISFTCNVCGMQGDRSPYICFQCDFMIHRECFGLPRVININRHDHRVSLTSRVGIANSKCGVCRKTVNQYYGGYSCSTCPNYVVHPQCAMKEGIWDWIELEGTPEEEIIPPYIVVGDNLIQHFSHKKHYLRLNKDDASRDDSSRCEACVLPVYSDPIYSCERCDFMLHEVCANLPMKKRLVFHTSAYTLSVRVNASFCMSCGIHYNGFTYNHGHIHGVDVSCGSFSEPFFFEGHSHPLYICEKLGICVACQETKRNMLGCDDCDFQVHLGCANLPKRVKHRSDDHYLTLSYGEEATGKYWCDICEGETDPRKWFYTCSDCGVTLHIECVLGDFSRLLPKGTMNTLLSEFKFEVVPNDKSDRPFCGECNLRCKSPFVLKLCDPNRGYICSERCLDLLNKRAWKSKRS